jgi:hypothetical protein
MYLANLLKDRASPWIDRIPYYYRTILYRPRRWYLLSQFSILFPYYCTFFAFVFSFIGFFCSPHGWRALRLKLTGWVVYGLSLTSDLKAEIKLMERVWIALKALAFSSLLQLE